MPASALAPQPNARPEPSDLDGGGLELTVVMPCLNEEKTLPVCIGKALRTMERLGIAGEVLVVDNGSTDRSAEVARAAGARVVHQPLRGYGNALRAGFEAAKGRFVLMGDSDDSYDFNDLGRFVDRLRGGADLVMGDRLGGEIKPGAMPWLHRHVGNPGLSTALNLMFHAGVRDSHCGLRAFTRDAYRRMNLQMPGMELASEMVIKASRAGLRIEQIPITLWPDGRGRRPHLRSFRDGWRHLRFMLMCCPTFLFLIPSILLVLAGLAAMPLASWAGYGRYDGMLGPNALFASAIGSICGAHLLAFGLLAKLHAHRADPVFRDPHVERVAEFFSVERGLVFGVSMMAVAAALGVPVVVEWATSRQVSSPSQWIFAGTLFVLGLEAASAAFLLGIMNLDRERDRAG